MTVADIIQAKMSLEEAKMAVYRLNFTQGEPGELEINQVFFPALASQLGYTGQSALQIIQEYFKSFDLHAQQREAKILEKYLKQLGSS